MTATSTADPAAERSLVELATIAFDSYRSGERARMGELVDLLNPILWHTARSQGLSDTQTEDVLQTAWLRLVDHADRVVDSKRVLAWMMTTVKREAWSTVKRARRENIDLDAAPDPVSQEPSPESLSVLSHQQAVLWRHVQELSERCRHLLRIVAFAERPDYAGVSQALGMPIGSIGPTRGRCLDQLRRTLTTDQEWGGHHE